MIMIFPFAFEYWYRRKSYERVLKLGGVSFRACDSEVEVTIMKNELCLVLRSTDQGRLLPGHEYEELHGLRELNGAFAAPYIT